MEGLMTGRHDPSADLIDNMQGSEIGRSDEMQRKGDIKRARAKFYDVFCIIRYGSVVLVVVQKRNVHNIDKSTIDIPVQYIDGRED
jgi:hypothetical protein